MSIAYEEIKVWPPSNRYNDGIVLRWNDTIDSRRLGIWKRSHILGFIHGSYGAWEIGHGILVILTAMRILPKPSIRICDILG